jgi:hypothetical protein
MAGELAAMGGCASSLAPTRSRNQPAISPLMWLIMNEIRNDVVIREMIDGDMWGRPWATMEGTDGKL